MNFGQAISTCLSNYANFSGRASRPEFWWFVLFQVIVLTVAGMVSETMYIVAALGLLLPMLSVGTRRLHDVGRSGWWQLLMFTGIGYLVLLYWWVQPTAHDAGSYSASAI